MPDLYSLIGDWEAIGVFDILLPFVVVFTLVFALLERTKLLGREGKTKKSVSAIIALALALLVVRNERIIELINRFLPNVAMFMIIILMFLMLIAIFGGEHTGWGSMLMPIAAIVSIIFVGISLGVNYLGDFWDLSQWWYDLFDEQTRAAIMFIAALVVVIWLVTRESKEIQPGQPSWWEKVGGKPGLGGSS